MVGEVFMEMSHLFPGGDGRGLDLGVTGVTGTTGVLLEPLKPTGVHSTEGLESVEKGSEPPLEGGKCPHTTQEIRPGQIQVYTHTHKHMM